MADADETTRVASAVGEVLQNEALREAVLVFGETKILVTKGRSLGERLPDLEDPPEYPDVQTTLKDEKDSWLK